MCEILFYCKVLSNTWT